MYQIIQKFHSGWAYIVLILLLIAAVNALIGLFGNAAFNPKDRKISLFSLITVHTQLLIGFAIYFISPLGLQSLGQMADPNLRLTSLEHPLTNIIAVVLVTIGWSKHKKAIDDNGKFKSIAVFYGLGLVLILSRLPWGAWLN